MNIIEEMNKFMELSEKVLNNKEKLEKELSKTDNKLMKLKLDKLNALIKKMYYDKDENFPEENMFQFSFVDKGDYYEFTIPLNILFGKKTREYCAKFWDNLFAKADINTSFLDNIEDAIKQVNNISLTMKLNKKLTKEIENEGEANG